MSVDVLWVVDVFCIPSVSIRKRESCRILVKESIAYIGNLRTLFLELFDALFRKKRVFESLRSSLLCKVGELAGCFSVAVGIIILVTA